MPAAALQIILLAIQNYPAIAETARMEFAAMRPGLTDAQKATIDAALEQAHAALQAAGPQAGN